MFNQINNLVFCLEEKDVRFAISNPHKTTLTKKELNKMKRWLIKKRLHSIDYKEQDKSLNKQIKEDKKEWEKFKLKLNKN